MKNTKRTLKDRILEASRYGRNTTVRGLASDFDADDKAVAKLVEQLVARKAVKKTQLTQKRFILMSA